MTNGPAFCAPSGYVVTATWFVANGSAPNVLIARTVIVYISDARPASGRGHEVRFGTAFEQELVHVRLRTQGFPGGVLDAPVDLVHALR